MDHQQTVKIRSTIKPELLRFTLSRGGWLAAAGALTIILGGTLLPLEQLKFWGIPVFFAGLGLIAVGLLPYRRLTRLQTQPNELIDDGEYLFFVKRGKPLLKIPLKGIEKIHYIEKEHLYGCGVWLKRPIEEKVGVLDRHFNFEAFATDSIQRFGCDLFLPYFSERALKQLLQEMR